MGSIPADMVKAGFKLLKPTMDLSTNINLWWNLWNPEYVSGFNALNKWANEYQPFPGEFFRQWVKDFYQQNRLVRGELRMGGRPVSLRNIHAPGAGGGREGRQYRAARLREAAHHRGVAAPTASTWSCRAATSPSSRDAAPRCTAGPRSRPGSPPGHRRIHPMADASSQLLDMWKKQVEEGSQAWLKMLGAPQAAPMDPQAFWRPFMDQGIAAWSKVMTPGAGLAGSHGPVEAVPRPMDRRLVQGARAGHGHRGLRQDPRQADGRIPQRGGAGEEGGRAAGGDFAWRAWGSPRGASSSR